MTSFLLHFNFLLNYITFFFSYLRLFSHFFDFLQKNLNKFFFLIIFSGQERFKNLSKMYIRGALGCIVVTDIMKPETMESGALDWKSLIETQADPLIDGKTIPIVLFGNKVDLIENKTVVADQTQNLKSFIKKHGFDGGFLTSAKENTNLTEAFSYLTQIIVNRHLSKTDLDAQAGFDNSRAVLKNPENQGGAGQGGSAKGGCC